MGNPQVVSQYILERKLGEGGMAEVWEARHVYLGNHSAIKFLLPRFAGDQELEARFLTEGKRQAQLRHPNIVSAIDFLQVDDRSYLVMQYVEGQNLETRLKHQQGPLSLEEMHLIAWDVLSGLDFAHSQHVVHRDIKPSNILLDQSGRVLISDFGIALAMRDEPRVTRTGLAIGTAEYMSPEQILHPRAVDYRADIYSFGCVLFAMLSGGPPFGGEESTEFFIKDCHVRNPPPSLRNLNAEVSPEVESVVLRCLEKDPGNRFQSCREVMHALDAAIQGRPMEHFSPAWAPSAPIDDAAVEENKAPEQVLAAPTPVIPVPASDSIASQRKSRSKDWLFAAAALIVLLALAAWGYLQLSGGGGETVLTMEGSTTVGLALAPGLVQEYLKSQGGTEVRQVDGTGAEKGHFLIGAKLPGVFRRQDYKVIADGSGRAFTALANGTAKIGMASRPINDAEHAALLKIGDFRSFASENVIGLDGIAVVVNRANPITELSRSQVRSIFKGETADWSPIGGHSGAIHIFRRDNESGTFDSFNAMVMDESNGGKTVHSKISEGAEVRDNGEDIAAAVAGDIDAIGFVGLPQVGGARALAVSDGPGTEALVPNKLTVSTEDYILSRRLFLYTAPNAAPEVEKFVRFALSDRGQEVVQRIGFVPLSATLQPVSAPPNAPADYREATAGKRRMRLDFRFRPNSFELDNKALADVGRAASMLGNGNTVYLLGFADSVGSYEKNLELSRKRAEVIADRFRQQGITVDPRGFSSEMPVADNRTEEGRQKNRRVEVWVQ